jgi:predicted dinucleotide-utilizing enzyme
MCCFFRSDFAVAWKLVGAMCYYVIRACTLVFNNVENVTVQSHFGVKRICTSNLYQSASNSVSSLVEFLIFVCLRSP